LGILLFIGDQLLRISLYIKMYSGDFFFLAFNKIEIFCCDVIIVLF